MIPPELKAFLFGQGKRPRRVLMGPGRGITLVIDPAYDSQRLLGLAEAELYRPVRRFARECRTFVDIGASNGWYCLLVSKLNPQASIIGCEPLEHFASEFSENVRLNKGSNDRFKWICSEVGSKSMSLDNIARSCSAPIFIKVDVEGMEADVLHSGLKMLGTKECFAIIETHSISAESDCMSILKALGYDVSIIDKAWYRFFLPEHRPLPHNRWLIAERAVPSG